MNINLDTISKFVTTHVDKLLLGAMAISLITLIIFIMVNIKLSKVIKRYNGLMEGVEGRNLESLLMYHSEELKSLKSELIHMEQGLELMSEECLSMISKVYSKRYNAFQGMGGDLSFSLALLNKQNTGVIITSIYGRDENRIYLKPIVEGRSDYTLSQEEHELISKALSL